MPVPKSSSDPDEWLRKAEGDLRVALRLTSDPEDSSTFREQIGFHCQQAAEKYLKALLTLAHVDFLEHEPYPGTHDLRKLVALAEPSIGPAADSLHEAHWLTPFGDDSLHSADSPQMLPGDELRAVEIATRVKSVVLEAMRAHTEPRP